MSSDPMNYTNPLSGHEVIADILGQIRRRLLTDCNLRATDGYSGGYSGEIKISLRLNAVRITLVEMTIAVRQSPEVPTPEIDPAAEVELVEVEEVISVPVEENLITVRDRINDNSEKAIEAEANTAEEPEPGVDANEPRAKRKYTRRAALVAATAGE